MENKQIEKFRENLIRIMKDRNISQVELSKKIGASHSCVWGWCVGRTTPKMIYIDKICDALHCKRSDLLTTDYYDDEETKKLAQEIFENRELHGLFDAVHDISADKLKLVIEMVNALKNKE